MKFVIKARAEYAENFRKVFKDMNAIFRESRIEYCGDIIIFNVECVPDKINMLEENIPIEAYANVGFSDFT